MITASVDFQSYICVCQFFQNRIQNVPIFFIRIKLVFVWTVADNIIQMSISVHFMKCIQILQNGFEIFKVGLFLVPALEKFRVVGVSTVDYVRRTNHEIERIFL